LQRGGREGEGASAQLGVEDGEGTTHLEHQNQCQEKLVERGEARRRTEATHDFLRGDRKGCHSLYIGYTSVIHRSTSGRTRGWHATSAALGHDASAWSGSVASGQADALDDLPLPSPSHLDLTRLLPRQSSAPPPTNRTQAQEGGHRSSTSRPPHLLLRSFREKGEAERRQEGQVRTSRMQEAAC